MNRIIFIIFSLFVMSMSVFGQNTLLKDLDKTFRNYDLVKLDNKVVLEKAKSRQLIKFQAKGREFEFVLTPNELRAANYIAIESTSGGNYELAPSEIITYKGKLRNDLDSEVRFTLTEETMEGFIYTGDEKIFINQAERFSNRAQKSDVIVYGENDLIKSVNLSDDIEGKMDFGFDIMRGGSVDGADAETDPRVGEAQAEAELRQLEVATEADYQWVTQAGSATAANNEILGIMNNVDGIYKRDLNLTIKVTFQHAWSSSDPFPSGSMSPMLDAFISHWNANYPNTQYPRDVAHLFTGKLSNQGLAYIGVICRNASYAYGLTARSGSVNHMITAHEIGHNLGADHVDNSGSCANSLMNPSLGSGVTGFCEASKNTIINFVTNYGSCLSPAGTTPTPTPTPTATPIPPTPTPTPKITPTPTPFPTVTPTPIPTPFPTPFPTATPTPNSTPSGRTNVALASNGSVASASSQSSSLYAAGLAINGGRTWGNGGGWRDNTLNSYPDWLQVDFNSSKTINEIDVYAVQDNFSNTADPSATETFSLYGITSFDVQYWNGSSWVTVPGGSITGNNKVVTKITFAAVTTSRIRVMVNAAQAGYSRIVEVEAWSGGSVNPTPTPTPNPTPSATPTPNPTPTATPTPNPTPSVRTNVALASNGGIASASSVSAGGYLPSLAINGGRTWGNGGGWRDNTLNSYPDWLQVDFNSSKTINEIDVYAVQDNFSNTADPSATETFSLYGITSFDVQYWNGSSWVTVPGGSITNNNKVVTKITFAAVTTSRIRVMVNAAQAGYSRIVEVEAWSGGTGNVTVESASGSDDINVESVSLTERLASWRDYILKAGNSLTE